MGIVLPAEGITFNQLKGGNTSIITQQTTAVTGNTITAAIWNNEFANIYNDYDGGITNANIATAAGIVYSKLSLTGGIVNADVSASAAIARTKIALGDVGKSAIEFVIGTGLATVSTGIAGWLEVPFACTITSATILADASGSAVVDIWKDTYANYPPTNADSITSSTPPTLSGAIKNTDPTLSGWTTSIAAGDILYFNVDSATTVKQLTVSLKVTL